jgi:O-antigen ligase
MGGRRGGSDAWRKHDREGTAPTDGPAPVFVPSSRPAGQRVGSALPFGPIGACTYLVGFAFPWSWDLPLMMLAVMSLLAILTGVRHRPSAWPPLSVPVLGFVVATAVAIFGSADVTHSLHLSAALLPGLLLFFLIAEHFPDLRATWLLYLTCSALSLGLAAALLWGVWQAGGRPPSAQMVLAVGSPILLVPNDAALLAVLAPLSLATLSQRPKSVGGLMAALALLLSAGAIVLLQSRTALLTMVAALVVAAVLLHGRRRLAVTLACGLASLALALLVDGAFGFPLMAKFVRHWDWGGSGRLPLWRAAWAMFLDAPWCGHGPHTFVRLYRSYLHQLGLPSSSLVIPWAHNLYLEVLAERGIIGFIALVVLLVHGLVAAWRLQAVATGEAHRLGVGALAGLIGLCGAAAVELTFLRQWVVIVLFMVLGVIAHLTSLQTILQKGDAR